jgi:pimeloyl-[acyl-carrier protein] methyl ester esterase
MPFLETDGAPRLAYTDRGEGPALVLVHGWSLSSAIFEDLAALLPGRRLVALDLRGHGTSEGAGPFTLAELAGDLAALLDRLDLSRAVVVGWSLGAQVALAALPAARARLGGLVLASATPRFTLGVGWTHGLPAQAVEVLGHRVRRDPARGLARFFEGMFAEGEVGLEAWTRLRALRAAIPLPHPAAAEAGLEILARTDLRGALPAIALPTLVLHGEADPICPPGAGRALAAAIPGARLAMLEGAGHAPFLSRPAAFADALVPFLREVA